MRFLTRIWQQYQGEVTVWIALMFASGLCTALVAVRIVYTDTLEHLDMLWNLFLAWIPLGLALIAQLLTRSHTWLRYPAFLGCLGLWLLFFPNAPYMVTDLIHLQWSHGIPFWYDATLLLAFAWTGLLLGYSSLYILHQLVAQSVGWIGGWIFAISSLTLGAFGVYLGRFLRWNSWDVFTDPMAVALDIWARLRHPFAHPNTYVVWIVLAAFFITAYWVMVAFTRLRATPQPLNWTGPNTLEQAH